MNRITYFKNGLAGVLLLLAFWTGQAYAADESLSLSINSALPGQSTTASIGIGNVADIESFSLELSFASGTALSLPASNWFTRSGYFPSAPFVAPYTSTNLNDLRVTTVGKKVFISGFKPTGSSGFIGTVTFNVNANAFAGTSPYDTPEKLPDTQAVTLSGKYFSKSGQVVNLAPVTNLFTVGNPLTSYALSVTRSGSGTVETNLGTLLWSGNNGSASYVSGSLVTLTPIPDNGKSFLGWTGACIGTGTCTVTMSQLRSVTASFTPSTYQLTVATAGNGSGSVNSSPSGIACATGSSSDCSASFASGTPVTLYPSVSNGSSFGGWNGACTNTEGNCSVTMNAAKSVTATFTSGSATVSVTGVTTPYFSIGVALDTIETADKTVRARDQIFTENVIMVSPAPIMLIGGYTDSNFLTQSGNSYTTLDGSLKVRTGTLRVERLKIK